MSPKDTQGFWARMGLPEEDRDVCVKAVQALYPGHRVEEFGAAASMKNETGGLKSTGAKEGPEEDTTKVDFHPVLVNALSLVLHTYNAVSFVANLINSVIAGPQESETGEQGYCSFTLVVVPVKEKGGTEEYIVQIRPERHSLDLRIGEAARETYGKLAPKVRLLECVLPGGLRAYEMERLRGVPLSRIDLEVGRLDQKVKLVESFAEVVARGWPAPGGKIEDEVGDGRADSPTEGFWFEQHCSGKVGREMVPKLRRLAVHLPEHVLRERARHRARDALSQLLSLRGYPVVLNHGDLIPNNILVDPESWEITGLVDWAEAEYLPFGTCFYGLEYLLGSLKTEDTEEGGVQLKWTYREGNEIMRRAFWETLELEVPELEGWKKQMMCMRDVGVLLWFGYAWDEGAINRVVNEVDDAEEVACLRAFLSVP